MNSFDVIDFLMCRSYCTQRDGGFNPTNCSKFIYQQMKSIFPEMEAYELYYNGEK